jgi:hypothetical protein
MAPPGRCCASAWGVRLGTEHREDNLLSAHQHVCCKLRHLHATGMDSARHVRA